jgi:hypothetical protein
VVHVIAPRVRWLRESRRQASNLLASRIACILRKQATDYRQSMGVDKDTRDRRGERMRDGKAEGKRDWSEETSIDV